MSEIDREIRKSLLTAEQRLRDLIVEAAKAADYDGIDMARSVAGRLRELVDEVESASSAGHETSNGGVDAACRGPARSTSVRAAGRKRTAKSYPKFYVEDGVLYKVGGRRKTTKSTYTRFPRKCSSRPFEQLPS